VNSLAVRQVKNAVVYPTIRVASHPGKLLMGVYDGDDAYVDGTVLDRRSGEQGEPIPRELFPDVTEADTPEAIYAGPLYFHFGHFLTESLSRAWYAREHPGVLFAWAGAHTWQDTELKPWQIEILDILGLSNRAQIIADPTRFDVLHVPDIGYRYDDWFHPDHAEFLGRYEGPAQEPGHRLWLSRSRIESDVRDLNAAPTERRLAEAGWTIAHPETLSVREQLDHLSRAEVVAGEEGSAFHSLVLLKDVSSKQFRILRRHGREHPNMHTIGDARGVNQTFHTLERERALRVKGRFVTKVNPNSSEILDLLDVPVPPAPASAPVTAADAILGQVIRRLGSRSVLDVGAPGPSLVVGSTAATRVAVSRSFDFDPRTYASSGVSFYELDLEDYAELFHGDRSGFDIIRISGSDFEDIMSAFRVSKRVAHDRTTWIFGSGDLAARAALAIRLGHPGFTAKRAVVRLRTVYIARHVTRQSATEADVGRLSAKAVKRHTLWMPVGVVPYGLRTRVKRILPARVKRLIGRAQRRFRGDPRVRDPNGGSVGRHEVE
jgi:hypothetical protein